MFALQPLFTQVVRGESGRAYQLKLVILIYIYHKIDLNLEPEESAGQQNATRRESLDMVRILQRLINEGKKKQQIFIFLKT